MACVLQVAHNGMPSMINYEHPIMRVSIILNSKEHTLLVFVHMTRRCAAQWRNEATPSQPTDKSALRLHSTFDGVERYTLRHSLHNGLLNLAPMVSNVRQLFKMWPSDLHNYLT
jgi:hypothetical protein